MVKQDFLENDLFCHFGVEGLIENDHISLDSIFYLHLEK